MKSYIGLLGMLVFVTSTFAGQKVPKYESESDSIECLKMFSMYSLNLKKKMYDYTVEPWNYMFKNCPQTSVKLYSDGIKLYSHYYKKAKTKERKNEVVDTIMMIYDQRIKYYSSHPKYPEGWILGRKATDLMKYRRGDVKSMKDAYSWFTKSFELMGDRSEDVVLFTWLKTSQSLMKHGDVNASQFINDFITISTVLDVKLANASSSNIERIKKIRNGCEEILIKGDVANCSSLVPLLTDQFNADSENPENIERIVNLLEKLDCNDSELYYTVVEKNYQINPSHSSAYHLAKMFIKKNTFSKAQEYYKKAIDICEEKDIKSKYYYELGVLEFAQNKNYQQARQYARQAISLKGDWGKPYMLIGNIYATGSNGYGKDEFDHATVYWVAIDNFYKAKNIDPECGVEADKQIALYSKYIPDKETGFFHGLQEGDSYKLGSWINESTKVRFR